MNEVEAPTSSGGRFRWLWIALIAIAAVNFFAFVWVASRIGGDAVNGEAVDGHYYLRNHAQITEVSRQIFCYSQWHARSLAITHPLGLFAAFMLNKGRVWEWRKRSR